MAVKEEFLNPSLVIFNIKPNDTIHITSNSPIKKGDLLLENNNSKIYSSISGTTYIKNNKIYIKNDFQETTNQKIELHENITKIPSTNILNIIKKILGIDLTQLKELETIAINLTAPYGCYLFNAYLIENYAHTLLDTIECIKKTLNKEVIIFISKQEKNIIDKLNNYLGSYPTLKVKILPSTFPYTFQEILNKRYFHKNENIFWFTTEQLYEINLALKENRCSPTTFISLRCSLFEHEKLIEIKKGTTYYEIIKKFIKNNQTKYNYYRNNILVKEKIKNLEDSITSFTIITIQEQQEHDQMPCIRCGKCINKCPLELNPRHPINEKCIKCGICNLVCPSSIPLTIKE